MLGFPSLVHRLLYHSGNLNTNSNDSKESCVHSRAQVNILIGFVVLAWIITPAAYYSNLWDAKVMPIMSMKVFSRDGYIYNISAVLDSNLRLNETAYAKYGRSIFLYSNSRLTRAYLLGEIRMTPIFAFSYGISFAAIAAVIVHTILYQGNDHYFIDQLQHSFFFSGKTIIKQFRSSLKDNTGDVHAKLMSHYKEAPEWWYTILFVLAFALAAMVCHFGQLMPWYYLFGKIKD